MRLAGRLAAAIALVAGPVSGPVSAQVSDDRDEEARASYRAYLDRQEARHKSFALECEEIEPDGFDPPMDEDALDALDENAVTDRHAFDCEADWVRIELALQDVLPLIGAPAYGNFQEPEGSVDTIAIRNVTIAYSAISLVRSVECHFARGERSWERVGIGGTARRAELRAWRSDDELAYWTLPLNASDCDYLMEVMQAHDPEDIIHNLPWGSAVNGNTIILVHGSSFMEFLDETGDYVVVLRPGLHEPADTQSEETEAALQTIVNYFAHRAKAEGEKTVLPPPDYEDDD